jgi:uncharacterized protein (DUF302 family)
MVELNASGDADQVEARLREALDAHRLQLFARIDHATGARMADVELEPNVLLIFGNTRVGTPLMQADPRVGIELPLRMLIWQDSDGTHVGYLDPRERAAPSLGRGTGARHPLRGRVGARRCRAARGVAHRGRMADDAAEPGEYQGHAAIRHFLANAFAGNWDHPHRLIPTRANTQPAFVHYAKDPHTEIGRALSLFVLTLDGNHISHVTRFPVGGPLRHFGFPRTIPW